MPRLRALASAGYYPSPDPVATALGRFIAPPPLGGHSTFRVLDPCCADGAGVLRFLEGMGDPEVETFGIELHAGRAEAAERALDHVIRGDARHARLAHDAFQVLYANPPYDSEADEDRRTEHLFVTLFTRALQPGGLLVLLVPQRRLGYSALYLSNHYRAFRCWRFPEPHWEPFHQVALLAIKKDGSVRDEAARDRLKSWAEGDPADLPPLPAAPEPGERLRAPAGTAGDILFAAGGFDPAAAVAEAPRRGAWGHPSLAARLWPEEEVPVRPLMPLRRGHLAQLVAAGFLDNIALRDGALQLLVKGRTEKRFRVVSDDASSTVEREEITTSVMLLDLATGELRQVGSVAADERQAP